MSEEGIKADNGKAPMSLIAYDVIEKVAQVLAFGAKKYAPNNWKKGMKMSRVMDATLRHIAAWNEGEDLDPESGLNHIDHALCELMFLRWYTLHKPELDDRFKEIPIKESKWRYHRGNGMPYEVMGLNKVVIYRQNRSQLLIDPHKYCWCWGGATPSSLDIIKYQIISDSCDMEYPSHEFMTSEGWIPHTPGDSRPVDADTIVKVLYRNGSIGDQRLASNYDWWCTVPYVRAEFEIIAYRIIEDDLCPSTGISEHECPCHKCNILW